MLVVVVVVVERVDGAGESPGGGVGERSGGVVRQRRVDRGGFINRGPVRRDETGEGGVGRREGRCRHDRSGAGG